jgi:L-asparaginase/beta-aspartyl-peptidase (threonine type)
MAVIRYGVVVHGGAGTPAAYADGCDGACRKAFTILEEGGSALDAVVEAVRLLEDDGRFNAGSGSSLRMDGSTVEIDAAVMDSAGRLGMVMAAREVKNPVLLAKAVTDTPHLALSGEGATLFARKVGLERLESVSLHALERYRRLRDLLCQGKVGDLNPLWKGHDIDGLWNFDGPSIRDALSCDTVGAIALDQAGTFAAAVSTGGASPMMLGRVGDTPMIGCGFLVGACCAVACTGIGEEIIRRMLAKRVYDAVSSCDSVSEACEEAVSHFPSEIPVGVIALSASGHAVVSNTGMASCVLVKEDRPSTTIVTRGA